MPSVPTLASPRLRQFAACVVLDECARRGIVPDANHVKLVDAVGSGLAAFLSIRRDRFPRLTANLAARLGSDRLPGSTVRALRATAVRAIVDRLAIRTAAPVRPVTPKARTKRHRRRYRKPASFPSRIYVPVDGIARLRTTKQAHAAGFATVADWTASLLDTPSPARLYCDSVTIEAQRAVTVVCRGREIGARIRAELASVGFFWR